jgi:predicted MPP superfamily phosphohydrolase
MQPDNPNNSIQRTQQWARWVGRNWARLSYGRKFEPTYLELTRQNIYLPDLPPALHNLKIVHLTDFHCGNSVPLAYLQHVIHQANEQQPDLIALTGDFIHKGYAFVDRAAKVVGELRAKHGVFAVLGNHDFAVRNAMGVRTRFKLHKAMELALHEHGIEVLRNVAKTLAIGDTQLQVIGVDDLWSGGCDVNAAFAQVSEHAPRLLLAHNPRTIEKLRIRQCDLVLSGHTHGGQINWPGRGRVLLGKRHRFAAGLYQHHGTYLYVNRGVGHGGLKFRFGVRPELAVLHLHPLTELPNAATNPTAPLPHRAPTRDESD